MQTIETLKRSIESAQDLASVVRTMKAMAAVSIRQYETATEALSTYARTIETGLSMLRQQPRNDSSVTKLQETGGRLGAIVFGSDQGMCGQFNQQIAHFTADTFAASQSAGHLIAPSICVGHRGADTLRSVGVDVGQVFSLPGSVGGITQLVQDLLPEMDDWRNQHQITDIWLFYNRRVSASTFDPHGLRLLPLQVASKHREKMPSEPVEATAASITDSAADNGVSESDSEVRPTGSTKCLPLWTMPTSVLFSQLLKQFLFVSVFRACAESQAGENASRIAAMQAAERNIKERLHELQASYASRRQTAITEELLDVVTGFEALEHGPNAKKPKKKR